MKRARQLLVILALISLFGGCGEPERVILLEVFSQSAVRSLDVRTISRDGLGPPVEFPTTPFSPARTPEELLDNPIRIVIRVAGNANVIVHLTGESEDDTRLVATRCYDVSGTVQDQVVLADIGPLAGGAFDQDGDTFLVDPAVACFEPAEGETAGRMCDPLVDEFICPGNAIADCDDTPRDDPTSMEQNCRPGTRGELNGFCIFPHAPVVCNAPGDLTGTDEDCDGIVDEACLDEDGDMFAACAEGDTSRCDCDDTNADINPDAEDICLDGTDQDCDGIDPCCDLDEDGVAQCIDRTGARVGDCVDVPEDCARQSPPCPEGTDPASINPDMTEVCDSGVDEDCSGRQNDSLECMGPDIDRDGVPACTDDMPGVVPPDCEPAEFDCNPGISPVARERCIPPGVDEDLDDMIDEADACPPGDADGDGQVAPQDCDDDDPLAYTHMPGDPVIERCGDMQAQSCVPGEDVMCPDPNDTDGDGFAEPPACEGDANIFPGQIEVCNDIDDDCDGVIDEVIASGVGCGGAPGTPAMVINFSNNRQHCGQCRFDCDTEYGRLGADGREQYRFGRAADQCSNGMCDCAAAPGDAACTAAGLNSICCADGCRDGATDPNNCGGCGQVCGDGETCSDGLCTCGGVRATAPREQACPDSGVGAENNRCCDSACTMVDNTVEHCGMCGNACSDGHANWECVSAMCAVATCLDGWADCDGDPTNGCETNLRTLSDCDGCGVACTVSNGTATCATGSCEIDTCDGDTGDCDGDPSNGCERSLRTLTDCGACDTVCDLPGGSESCSTGTCRVETCDALLGNCDGDHANGCERALTSLTSCGGCGDACSLPGGTETCVTGTCEVDVCNPNRDDCDGNPANGCETDLRTLSDCGSCGSPCTVANGTATCSSGSCQIDSCDRLRDDCDRNPANGCETDLTTLSDCGSCTMTCDLPSASETCSTGSCEVDTCDSGVDDCDMVSSNGCEASLSTLTNCGGCGVLCARDHASETCMSETCRTGVCDPNFDNCDGLDMNGCETDLRTVATCGSCSTPCDLPNASERCDTGTCELVACDPSFGDCDMDAGTGCETPLTTLANCGSCTAPPCSLPHATPTCGTGECRIESCDSGWDTCDSNQATGCETDITTMMHCGSCVNSCNPATADGCSSAGACQCNGSDECTGPGEACCGGSGCRDLRTDPMNCGGCGVICDADETCMGGRCRCNGDSGSVGGGAVCPNPQVCCSSGCAMSC